MRGETVVIERRFRGPLNPGHGGYTCGLLAREIPGTAEVSLLVPPSLERQLRLERVGDGRVMLRDGEVIVADARAAPLELDPPPRSRSATHEQPRCAPGSRVTRSRWFPMCFGCGPEREQGDGLRLFPGPVKGQNVIACPWRPNAALANENGLVRTEFVWAALDCPTAFACDLTGRPIVLARLTGRIDNPLDAGEQHVITAWHIGCDGRKQHSHCTISTPDGEVLARSQALWIEPKDPTSFGVATSRLGSTTRTTSPAGRTPSAL